MSYQPDMPGTTRTNVFTEHEYKVRATFGSSVVTSYRGKDVTFVRNSAGNYTVTLPQTYEELTDFDMGFLQASGAILQGCVVSHTLSTNGQLIIEVRNASGTATDPATGSVGFMDICVSQDVLNSKFAG